MTTKNPESITQQLIHLNTEIGDIEQQGAIATNYFTHLLSNQLIFRRASGTAIGKHDFIENLKTKKPFTSHRAEDIVVNPISDRILVTLIVATTKADDSQQRYRNVRNEEDKENEFKSKEAKIEASSSD